MMLDNTVLFPNLHDEYEKEKLPRFRVANGLLSPQTVMRLEARSNDFGACEFVLRFLDTYRSRGPMACLSYLSDPNVLPALTKAMREAVH